LNPKYREIGALLSNLCSRLDLPNAAAFYLHASQGATLNAQFRAGAFAKLGSSEKAHAASGSPSQPVVSSFHCQVCTLRLTATLGVSFLNFRV
jgi:hypothetical protein